ncbi:NFU1 iron-sulfur cluster scaffold homolog, mitochondrial-like isoform X1 [Styela clava]
MLRGCPVVGILHEYRNSGFGIMVSPRMCGVGSLFCSPLFSMEEENHNHLLDDTMNHPGMTCRMENTRSRSHKCSSYKNNVSRSTSHNSDISTSSPISHCSSCTTDSLGDRVVVARPGLVIVRNAESMSIDSVPASDSSVMLFYPGCSVLSCIKDKVTFNFSSLHKCNSPLVRQLLKLNGVEQVTLASDHIQVKKVCHKHKDNTSQRFCSVSWRNLKPEILATMIEFFSSGIPVLEEENMSCDSLISLCEEDSGLIIQDLIESRIRPMVKQEGGDVAFVEYRSDHCVVLTFSGTCISTRAATNVLKDVILGLLQFHVPDVSDIIEITSTPT